MSPQTGPAAVEAVNRTIAPGVPRRVKSKCYTPQLRQDIVSRLYYRAKAKGVPMTRVANEMMQAALDSSDSDQPGGCGE